MKRILATSLAGLVIAIASIPALAEEETTWTDRISIKGDLRLRQEGIDEDGDPSRSRSRYRARLAMSAAVHPDVTVVMELASGADDPVSRNVTFDNGFTTNDLGFDLAYVEWAAADGLKIYGGKMKNPLYRAGGAPPVWDSDMNPEGIAARYGKGAFFATVAGFSVEERASSDDSSLYALQLGGKFAVSDDVKITVGLGYFSFSNTIGNTPFYNGNGKGNSVDASGNYIYDYKDTEVFAQLDTKVANWPLSVYAHWAQNGEVDVEDTAYAVGASIGTAGKQGDKQFSWTYQDVEADAVIATFNDSDFGGGGTDASGHILKAAYAVSNSISLGATFFINEGDRFQGTAHDYNRFQLDLSMAFK